jgi:hypothetical protein
MHGERQLLGRNRAQRRPAVSLQLMSPKGKAMSRHVGGSLLPSNEPGILQPVETPFGTLQVRVIAELDTHGLFHKHAAGESLLATHPNGYSCRALLDRMTAKHVDRVREQVQYILDCGGTARHVDHIVNTMQL